MLCLIDKERDTLVGEGGDNRKTEVLSENMQPCHSTAFMFSVKMCFNSVEIISVLFVSDHCI